jgi:pimeloyl-ACP methyl ester carboxylesterase
MDTTAIRHQRVSLNGVELDLTLAGPTDGELVICVHGFPESAHSWRHQLPALANAGYHAVAPDMRGYAHSAKFTEVADYGIEKLTGDLVNLLDYFDAQKAVFVGHDWGALITWDLARLHPERVKAVINVSVPFIDWPAPPTSLFKAMYGDNFFYMLYFQPVGPVEAELDPQAERFLKAILWAGSGEGYNPDTKTYPAKDHGWLDTLPTPPAELAPWLSSSDFATYTEQFKESGFFGPCSYYRNLDANHELVKNYPASLMTMPIWFIGGTKDMVIARDLNGINRMSAQLPNYQGHVLIEGAGHWTQQERPQEFNAALLGFLKDLRSLDYGV